MDWILDQSGVCAMLECIAEGLPDTHIDLFKNRFKRDEQEICQIFKMVIRLIQFDLGSEYRCIALLFDS